MDNNTIIAQLKAAKLWDAAKMQARNFNTYNMSLLVSVATGTSMGITELADLIYDIDNQPKAKRQMPMATVIASMKAWCVKNYDKGADTMVECWGTEDYADMIARHNGDIKAAWATLKSVAEVYADRQADARNNAF